MSIGMGDPWSYPFGPLCSRRIFDHRQRDQPDERRHDRGGHTVQAAVGHSAGVDADDEEET